MTRVAEELDRRLQALDPKRAARAEQLVRDVLLLIEDEPALESRPRGEYSTRTNDSGLMPGIDPTKLGQIAEEI